MRTINTKYDNVPETAKQNAKRARKNAKNRPEENFYCEVFYQTETGVFKLLCYRFGPTFERLEMNRKRFSSANPGKILRFGEIKKINK